MFCPSCGKQIPAGSTFCMHCGKAVPAMPTEVSQTIQHPTKASIPTDAPVCTSCGQMDATQKMIGLLSTQTSMGTESSKSIGGGIAASGSSSGGSLGGFLATSGTQREVSSASYLVHEALKISSVESRLAAAEKQMSPSSGPLNNNSQANAFWRAERWFRAGLFQLRWRQIYYCNRCAGIFALGESDFASVDDMGPVLFRPPVFSGYEICEVESAWALIGRHSTFYYIACAFGRDGFYATRAMSWKDGMFHKNPPELEGSVYNALPNYNCKACKQNHSQFLRQLADDGWERTDERTDMWFQVRFRRKAATVQQPDAVS